jgi:glycosyltransferase involved in cell wall biosynthesis
LKIGILIPEFPSQTHAFFWREVLALRSLGVDVVLVSTRRPPPEACRHEFASEAAARTVYLFPPEWLRDALSLLLNPMGLLKAFAYVAGLVESSWPQRLSTALLIVPAARLARQSRLLGLEHVHVHSFANSAHVAALARVLSGCTYSLTLHGAPDGYGKDHGSKTRGASFVTCVSAPLKQQLAELLGPSSPGIHLLWMGVDTMHFVPRERPPRNQSAPLRLLTVARLHANKGHRFALRAIRRNRDEGLHASYTIVGDGPARAEIEQEIESLGLSGSVQLVGTRSESEVQLLLHGSDALLLTSVGSEGAPVAIMEAMACGVPVVSSVIGGTTDMIEHGEDGFLVGQGDVDGIAQSLRQLSEEPELAWRMGNAARLRAVRDFDSKALAGRFLELIVAAGSAR